VVDSAYLGGLLWGTQQMLSTWHPRNIKENHIC
jgi:hypothetical protein